MIWSRPPSGQRQHTLHYSAELSPNQTLVVLPKEDAPPDLIFMGSKLITFESVQNATEDLVRDRRRTASGTPG